VRSGSPMHDLRNIDFLVKDSEQKESIELIRIVPDKAVVHELGIPAFPGAEIDLSELPREVNGVFFLVKGRFDDRKGDGFKVSGWKKLLVFTGSTLFFEFLVVELMVGSVSDIVMGAGKGADERIWEDFGSSDPSSNELDRSERVP